MVGIEKKTFLSSKFIYHDKWLENIFKKNCYITQNLKIFKLLKNVKNSFILLKTKKKIAKENSVRNLTYNPTSNEITYSVINTTGGFSNPPTDAELDTEFGTPATVGAGFSVDLDNGSNNVYRVLSNGTSWFILSYSLAT